jgi:hypothetical protein
MTPTPEFPDDELDDGLAAPDTSPPVESRVIDTAETDEHRPFTYDIAVSTSNPDVFGLVRRLQNEDMIVPWFQRGYVWTRRQADRFIESLLLNLPVPGIFLAELPGETKQLVLDGQQRLRTLQYFYEGLFDGREYALRYTEPQFRGLTYKKLSTDQRRALDNKTLSATIVRQFEPRGHESIFLIFERINSGGTSLGPQEIRSALFNGPFERLIRELNQLPTWRAVFGPPSKRMKDQELILRYFALTLDGASYSRPMKSFLNDFMEAHRDLKAPTESELRDSFVRPTQLISDALGPVAFRPQSSINAAVFDSVMVGTSRRLSRGIVMDHRAYSSAYFALLDDPDYRKWTGRATADAESVRGRIRLATAAFADVP